MAVNPGHLMYQLLDKFTSEKLLLWP